MCTIASVWESFAAAVLSSPSIGDTQRKEMRRAFYAGAHGMLCTVQELGSAQVSEEAGVAVLQSLMDESVAFAESVKQGRA